ncbi:hypothetical protein JANAI62_19220 [Jannaschia pagri]|uniref:SH3 domain-containing protein n=1 Tax=Jannaschia pagri TaxID=2829797 RepID=A0ABQ4NLN5_9RHOB|nr:MULTISPECIES: SH3 domain-containing protein [unclassified Jannaschia]GIT91465.1 hypothetical protein JANAI61_19230 [Jannaschia sp. AI_61]GIT95299.1 hypothetical protein JANAI62_19220 [Jannaschia sp. AI_62]
MRALVALLIWAAGPVWATQDAWPAFYDVAGVAADDVLNIRAAPNPGADIIGTLAPDAVNVEVITPNQAETWGRVNVGERSGWVSLRFLTRQPGQWLGSYPQIARCSGTEPFWALSVGEDTVLSTPEGSSTGVVVARTTPINRRDRHGLMLWLDDGLFQGVIAQQQCGDGMSDRVMGLEINAFYGGDMLSGCCTLTP